MATVLVTGTNRGIGLEFVEQFIKRGDRILTTCRSFETADDLRQLHMSYSDLHIFNVDVSDPESMVQFASQLAGEPIDIFVNNAGVYGPKDVKLGDIDGPTWMDVLQVNTIAPLLMTQLLLENLKKGKHKKLVYLTSKMGSIEDNQGGGAYIYRSSKTALNQVVKSLSVDLAGDGFSVAVVHPGWVLTDMGGPNALIDTGTSVTGMLKVIDELTPATTGSFFNYDGTIIPW